MKVEILIYAYLAVCASMIAFNIACIFVFRRKDKKIDTCKTDFTDEIKRCIESNEVDEQHRKYLFKKLRRINNLMAFDKTLEELYPENPEKIRRYIKGLSPVFVYLSLEYLKKNKLQAAYFPYIIKKYRICSGQNISIITDAMLMLVRDPSLYCRENAMQALNVIGDAASVIKALRIIDEYGYYHHSKLISDGLLEFSGDKERLSDMLWREFPNFSEKMQVTVLDYFRFSSGDHSEQILRLLTSENRTDEIAYSCIRYLGKYHYEPAYPYLLDFAEASDEIHWEYAAITATALACYPCKKTEEALKALLHSKNWYVRYNASQSLDCLGFDYTDLIDIFEGDDRYAGEIMRYRLDQKKMKEKETSAV
ncbi:MAG: HEAT repeat domain-containing protein [Christensenellales bacterium]